MLKFTLMRLLQAVPVLFGVVTATFFLIRQAPGGPFDEEKPVIPAVKRALEAKYNLDLPVWQQYTQYLSDLFKGNLGPSFKYPGWQVEDLIISGLPTLSLIHI